MFPEPTRAFFSGPTNPIPAAPRSTLWVVVCLFLAFGLLALPVSAQAGGGGLGSVKVSAPLTVPPNVEGDVRDAALSPDGRWAVYSADQETLGVVELYAVPMDGSASAVRLNGTLAPGAEVDFFRIAPAGARVVYRARQESDSAPGLYGVQLDGSAPAVRLDEPDAAVDLRLEPSLSADGRRVVYLSESRALCVVPVDGAHAPVELGTRPLSGGRIESFRLAPGGRRVVFNADLAGNGVVELFAAPLDTLGAPGHARRAPPVKVVRLNAPLAPYGGVWSYRISADGQRVVYQADQEQSFLFELYRVSIDGGAAVKVSAPIVSGGRLVLEGFELGADDRRVVYLAEQRTRGVQELFSAPLDGGGAVVRLNGTLVSGGDVHDFQLGGARVVYSADQETDGVRQLYGAPLDGSAGAQAIPFPHVREELRSYALAPDGGRVVFELYERARRLHELYSAATVGGASIPLGEHFAWAGETLESKEFEYRLTPDGQRAVYLTDHPDGRMHLFSVALDGRSHRAGLSGTLAVGESEYSGGSDGFTFALGADTVLFLAHETPGSLELYHAALDGGTAPRKLNPPLAPGGPPGDVLAFQLSADASRVVYRADAETDEHFGLYAVPSEGSGSPVALSSSLPADESVGAFALTPAHERAVFLSGSAANAVLRSVPLAGGPALALSAPRVSGGRIEAFELSPDGTRAVYSAEQDVAGVTELYSVPVGGGVVVKLNGPLVPGGDVWTCQSQVHPHAHFTPDGRRVLYVADAERDEVGELYSVPVDGSAPPIKLSGTQHGAGIAYFAFCFLLDASGTRVVYQADADTPGVYELYSAPVDGSAAPRRLNGPLVDGGNVSFGQDGVALSPDGRRVVYLADAREDEVFELYSVPLDGSAGALRISPVPVADGDVYGRLRIDSGSARVVFAGDLQVNERVDLFSAPLDGSAAAVKLDGSLANDRDVQYDAFEIDPSGTRVVYASDAQSHFAYELFSAPIDGSALPVALEAPLNPGGDVPRFALARGWVVYSTPRDTGAFDLFRVSLLGDAPPVRLSGPMAGGGVLGFGASFALGPDGSRVFYLADQETAQVFELFASPLMAPRPTGGP